MTPLSPAQQAMLAAARAAPDTLMRVLTVINRRPETVWKAGGQAFAVATGEALLQAGLIEPVQVPGARGPEIVAGLPWPDVGFRYRPTPPLEAPNAG